MFRFRFFKESSLIFIGQVLTRIRRLLRIRWSGVGSMAYNCVVLRRNLPRVVPRAEKAEMFLWNGSSSPPPTDRTGLKEDLCDWQKWRADGLCGRRFGWQSVSEGEEHVKTGLPWGRGSRDSTIIPFLLKGFGLALGAQERQQTYLMGSCNTFCSPSSVFGVPGSILNRQKPLTRKQAHDLCIDMCVEFVRYSKWLHNFLIGQWKSTGSSAQ